MDDGKIPHYCPYRHTATLSGLPGWPLGEVAVTEVAVAKSLSFNIRNQVANQETGR